jgi:hypothetical protein
LRGRAKQQTEQNVLKARGAGGKVMAREGGGAAEGAGGE